eukprot:6822799-Lingulodinium_polyedra.AAC.1
MQPPEHRPSVSGAPAVRGDAIAQYLDVRFAASETPCGRLGVEVVWTPVCRDLIVQLATVSGETVL